MKYPFNYVIGIIFLAKVFLRIGFNNTKNNNTYTDLGCAFNFSFQYGSLKTESKTDSTQSQ